MKALCSRTLAAVAVVALAVAGRCYAAGGAPVGGYESATVSSADTGGSAATDPGAAAA